MSEAFALEQGVLACLGPKCPSKPHLSLPRGAWDTHFHVLGPTDRYPYATGRRYTPPDAPLAACLALHDTLGIGRGWVVHANTHGTDNRPFLDAVAASEGRYVGVVRLTGEATRAQCRDLHHAGVRGTRFAFNPEHGGTLDQSEFNHVVSVTADLGWFIDLHFTGEMLPRLRPWLETIPANVVIDHFGRVDASAGPDSEPFRVLCDLAERDNMWVKLSGVDRISAEGYPYADVVPLARRLTEVAPDRLIWGTDWPHTGYFDSERMPDDGLLVDTLALMVPDELVRDRILTVNPNELLRGTADAKETL